MYRYTVMYTYIYMDTHTVLHTPARIHMRTHTCTHTPARTHTRTHTYA